MFESEDSDRCPATDGGEALREMIERLADLKKEEPVVSAKEEIVSQKSSSVAIKAARGLFLVLLEGISTGTRNPFLQKDNFPNTAPDPHVYRASPLSTKKEKPTRGMAS